MLDPDDVLWLEVERTGGVVHDQRAHIALRIKGGGVIGLSLDAVEALRLAQMVMISVYNATFAPLAKAPPRRRRPARRKKRRHSS